MFPIVLTLAVLFASGCVWYVPALADVRAGADRPPARRVAALACLTGWGTAPALAVLLLAGAVGPALVAVPALSGLACAGLLLRAAFLRRRAAREEAHYWAALLGTPARRPAPARGAGALARWTATGLIAATACTALLTTSALAR
ncbi:MULTISPECIES: hypothetical protein [unclassified Streptomyces]|uniref:hypothetical protein n=1 Tax=unclassified Streptomyces TaxID=2593676 RepID=UPI001F5BD36C|nr:hypothetical protein [Streptomyces sp. HSG2]